MFAIHLHHHQEEEEEAAEVEDDNFPVEFGRRRKSEITDTQKRCIICIIIKGYYIALAAAEV